MCDESSAAGLSARNIYLSILIASGLVLTALAVGWWVFADWRGDNRYQVTILDLGKDEKITSSYYSHVSPRGDSPIHDDYFLIVQNTPFKVGDKFEFAYSTGTPPSTGLAGAVVVPLEIIYSGNNSETYRIGLSNGKASIVAADESSSHQALLAAAGR